MSRRKLLSSARNAKSEALRRSHYKWAGGDCLCRVSCWKRLPDSEGERRASENTTTNTLREYNDKHSPLRTGLGEWQPSAKNSRESKRRLSVCLTALLRGRVQFGWVERLPCLSAGHEVYVHSEHGSARTLPAWRVL